MSVTATLKNWELVDFGSFFAIKGTIEGDSKERFSDGVEIRTSKINAIYFAGDGEITAVTRNSVYKLEKPSVQMDAYRLGIDR